jgi:hypothetical protein
MTPEYGDPKAVDALYQEMLKERGGIVPDLEKIIEREKKSIITSTSGRPVLVRKSLKVAFDTYSLIGAYQLMCVTLEKMLLGTKSSTSGKDALKATLWRIAKNQWRHKSLRF